LKSSCTRGQTVSERTKLLRKLRTRFMRTLKEQLLWLRNFRNLEELRQALLAFKEQYNEHWLIERNGFRSPRQARQDLLALGAAA